MLTSYLNQNQQIVDDKVSASLKFEGLKNQPLLLAKTEATFGEMKVKDLEDILKCELFSADLFKSYLRIQSVIKEIATACQRVMQMDDVEDGEDMNSKVIAKALQELKDQGQNDHILDKLRNVLGDREHRMIVVDPPILQICEEKVLLVDEQGGDDEGLDVPSRVNAQARSNVNDVSENYIDQQSNSNSTQINVKSYQNSQISTPKQMKVSEAGLSEVAKDYVDSTLGKAVQNAIDQKQDADASDLNSNHVLSAAFNMEKDKKDDEDSLVHMSAADQDKKSDDGEEKVVLTEKLILEISEE